MNMRVRYPVHGKPFGTEWKEQNVESKEALESLLMYVYTSWSHGGLIPYLGKFGLSRTKVTNSHGETQNGWKVLVGLIGDVPSGYINYTAEMKKAGRGAYSAAKGYKYVCRIDDKESTSFYHSDKAIATIAMNNFKDPELVEEWIVYGENGYPVFGTRGFQSKEEAEASIPSLQTYNEQHGWRNKSEFLFSRAIQTERYDMRSLNVVDAYAVIAKNGVVTDVYFLDDLAKTKLNDSLYGSHVEKVYCVVDKTYRVPKPISLYYSEKGKADNAIRYLHKLM